MIYINGKFLTQKITGVQRYAREIIKELDKLVNKDEIIILVPNGVNNDLNLTNIKVLKTGKLKGNLWEQISLPLYVMKHKGELLNLCNSAPIIHPDIITIHDVKIKARPNDFSENFLKWYNFMFKRIIPKSNMIITVSNFSKSEIMKYYHIDEKKIHVIYNAWQHFERIGYNINALNKYELEKNNYYFAMSSLEPNKNFKWIAEVAKRNQDEIFAIAGSINKKIFDEGLGFECPKNMKLLGYISDKEAKTLMKYTKAFLFPSFYEGFGIPPLEALSAGTKKIIVSDIPVMHELFGENINYIDPYDNMYDLSKYELKEINSKEILSEYLWNKSAIKLYRLLIDKICKVYK